MSSSSKSSSRKTLTIAWDGSSYLVTLPEGTTIVEFKRIVKNVINETNEDVDPELENENNWRFLVDGSVVTNADLFEEGKVYTIGKAPPKKTAKSVAPPKPTVLQYPEEAEGEIEEESNSPFMGFQFLQQQKKVPSQDDIRNCLAAAKALTLKSNMMAEHFEAMSTIVGYQRSNPASTLNYIMCRTETRDLIVAFDGSDNLYEVLKVKNHMSSTEALSLLVPDRPFITEAKDATRRILFTGLGLGGTMATLVCLRVLKQIAGIKKLDTTLSDSDISRIECLTFSAPLGVRSILLQDASEDFRDHFHHYLHPDDFLPRVLTITESVRLDQSLRSADTAAKVTDEFLFKFDELLADSMESPKKKKLGDIKERGPKFKDQLLAMERQHRDNYSPCGWYHLFPSGKCVDTRRRVPFHMSEFVPLPDQKKQLKKMVTNYKENMFNKYSTEKFLTCKRSVPHVEELQEWSLLPRSKEAQTVSVFAYTEKTVIVIPPLKNLEFTCQILVPALHILVDLPKITGDRIRIEVPTPKVEASQESTRAKIIVVTHFGPQKVFTIDYKAFIPKMINAKLQLFGRLSPGMVLHKALVFYTILKKIYNYQDLIEKIRFHFDLIQEAMTYEDLILSLCYWDRTKKLLQDMGVSEATFIQRLNQLNVEQPNKEASFNKELDKYLPHEIVSLLTKFGARIKPEVATDFRGTKYTHFTILNKNQYQEPLPSLDITASRADIREHYLEFSWIQTFLDHPRQVTSGKPTTGGRMLTQLPLTPLHLLLLPLDAVGAVLGLIGGAMEGVSSAVSKKPKNFAKELFNGLSTGALALHRVVYYLTSNNSNYIYNYDSLLLFLAGIANTFKTLVKLDEATLEEYQTYEIEKQLASISEFDMELISDAYKTIVLFGESVQVSDVLEKWLHKITVIGSLRTMLINAPFGLGVIGTCKTGKSFLLNAMWGCNTNPGRAIPTSVITPYELEKVDNFILLDFPGSDEINPIWRECQQDGVGLISFYIVVLDYEHINLKQKETVDFIASCGVPFMLLLNRADTLYLDLKHKYPSASNKDIKMQILDVLHTKIALLSNAFLSEDNVFLTCLDSMYVPDHMKDDMYQCGIKSIDDMRSIIGKLLEREGLQSANKIMDKATRAKQRQASNLSSSPLEVPKNRRESRPRGDAFSINAEVIKATTDVERIAIMKRGRMVNEIIKSPSQSQNFKVQRVLKKSGQVRVYLMYNYSRSELVVLKMLNCWTDDDFRAALEEFKMLTELSHSNIVKPYFSWNEHHDQYDLRVLYIEMKYYLPGDLGQNIEKRIVNNERYTMDFMVEFMLQLVDALCYLQQQGILHRDIKPGNILLDGNTPLLIDFGSSKRVEQNSDIHTKRIGTMPYFAPEIASLHGSSNYTNAIDVWSLGCVFLEMLTLSKPYQTIYYEQAKNATKWKQELNTKLELAVPTDPLVCQMYKKLGTLVEAMLDPKPANRIAPTTLLANLQTIKETQHRRSIRASINNNLK